MNFGIFPGLFLQPSEIGMGTSDSLIPLILGYVVIPNNAKPELINPGGFIVIIFCLNGIAPPQSHNPGLYG
jgi:hypothetical protein